MAGYYLKNLKMGTTARQHQYLCQTCQKSFPAWYWGVSGKAGGAGTVRKPGLARANFNRHQEACRVKKRNDENRFSEVREYIPEEDHAKNNS